METKRKHTYARNSQTVRGEEQRAEKAKKRKLRDDDPAGAFRGDQFVLKTVWLYKVQLIEAGYKALRDDAAEHNLALGKLVDGYDDFFSSELEAFEKQKKDN